MKSTYFYLVTPVEGREMVNEGDHGMVLNTNIEDHKFTNRLGTVVGLPGGLSEIQLGDTVLVHHNTFRPYYDFKGRLKKSANYLFDDIYYVEKDRIYMYYRNDSEMVMSGYCFVRPILRSGDGFEYSTRAEKELIGEVVIPSKDAISEGIGVGHVVAFKPDSEYEFKIGGERVYRVPVKNIYAVL
jgi:hypothetical protein